MYPSDFSPVLRAEVLCSWCHEMNDARHEFCASCGHATHESRANCYCHTCRELSPRAAVLPFRRKEAS